MSGIAQIHRITFGGEFSREELDAILAEFAKDGIERTSENQYGEIVPIEVVVREARDEEKPLTLMGQIFGDIKSSNGLAALQELKIPYDVRSTNESDLNLAYIRVFRGGVEMLGMTVEGEVVTTKSDLENAQKHDKFEELLHRLEHLDWQCDIPLKMPRSARESLDHQTKSTILDKLHGR